MKFMSRFRIYVLASLLLLLALFLPVAGLLTATIFTFLLPGFPLVQRFFDFNAEDTLLLGVLLSVLVSTHLVFAFSLLIGYSKQAIFLTFFVELALSILLAPDLKLPKLGFSALVPLAIFLICLLTLWDSVWVVKDGYVVLAGSNWQDTPMHFEIIESINQGNFPPQAPFFAGEKLRYHFFMDFHTAIFEKMHGGFLPKLIVPLNAVFAGIFALALYCLGSAFGDKEVGIYAALLGTLGWGLAFVNAASDALTGGFSPSKNYAFVYDGFFTIPPILDNLLQQRPQLVGLPTLTAVILLLHSDGKKETLLAGALTALLLPFHAISFLACLLAFLAFLKREKLWFLIPLPLAIPFLLYFSVGEVNFGRSWASVFLEGNPVVFYAANLGIPLFLALPALLNEKRLLVWFSVIFALPHLPSFTPNAWDMFKFFHYAWVPISVSAALTLRKLPKGVVIPLLIASLLTSALVVLWNVSTEFPCASLEELKAGLWVRESTPQCSVFLTAPSIHCPPTMIGGRLRVLSYVNWPYGHGLDVWERLDDVERAFSSVDGLREVIEKYNVSYVYVGPEERKLASQSLFDNAPFLRLIYDKGVRIYEVTTTC